MEKLRYIDVPKNFTNLGNNILFYDAETSIIESIKNIIEIPKNTRIMKNDFGSILQSFLFSPITASLGFIIAKTLENEIRTYEPRIDDLEIVVDYTNEDYIIIQIKAIMNAKTYETSTKYFL